MYYIISALQTAIPDVKVLRGMTGPKIESGQAKWEVDDRPKRKGATTYQGLDPLRMSLPVMFDGYRDKKPVEADINNIERMRMEVGGKPPIVRVNDGIAGGLPRKGINWVIEGIDYGDMVIWDYSPQGVLVRFRQDATINLLEYVEIDIIKIGSHNPGNTRGTGSTRGPKNQRVTVKPGQTLQTIANDLYGDRSKWQDIADANGIRDPKTVMPGMDLRIP